MRVAGQHTDTRGATDARSGSRGCFSEALRGVHTDTGSDVLLVRRARLAYTRSRDGARRRRWRTSARTRRVARVARRLDVRAMRSSRVPARAPLRVGARLSRAAVVLDVRREGDRTERCRRAASTPARALRAEI